MKTITSILLTFVLSSSIVVLGQSESNENISENQKRIIEIPKRINEAVAAENYQEAANLKEELQIRKKMAVAQSNSDYDRIAELEKNLANCECRPKPNKQCVDEKLNANKRGFCSMRKNYNPKKKFNFYMDMIPLGYVYSKEVESGVPSNEVQPTPNEVINHQFGFGKTMGSSFYFGDMDKDFKVGFDLIYMTIMASNTSFDFNTLNLNMNFAQPGIVFTKYFSDGMSGVDHKINVGMNRNRSFDKTSGSWGANAVGQIKYWKKGMSIGLMYQYGMGLEQDFDYHQVGMTFGVRF